MLMKKCKSGFYAMVDVSRCNIFQVKIPGLPLKLWNEATVKEIENRLGRFYYWDHGYLGNQISIWFGCLWSWNSTEHFWLPWWLGGVKYQPYVLKSLDPRNIRKAINSPMVIGKQASVLASSQKERLDEFKLTSSPNRELATLLVDSEGLEPTVIKGIYLCLGRRRGGQSIAQMLPLGRRETLNLRRYLDAP